MVDVIMPTVNNPIMSGSPGVSNKNNQRNTLESY